MTTPSIPFKRLSVNRWDTADPNDGRPVPAGTMMGILNGVWTLLDNSNTSCTVTVTDGSGAGTILVNGIAMIYGYPGYWYYDDIPTHAVAGATLLVQIKQYDVTGTIWLNTYDFLATDNG